MKKKNYILISIVIALVFISGIFISYLFLKPKINLNHNFDFVSSFNNSIQRLEINTDKLIKEKEEKRKEKIKNCLLSPIPNEEINESLKSKIYNLESSFKNNAANFSYYYYDLTTGFSLSYNEKAENWAASVIKAPVAIYIYELASKGEIDLDEKLTYTPGYYAEGTGVIKKQAFYSKYTIRTLVEYAIKYSDNIAHRMLVRKFGMDNIKKYWQNLGSTSIFENNQMFSNFNAYDGYLVMKKLYDFSNQNEYGKELLSFFKSAKPNFVVGDKDDEIAHKYGWGQNALHDMTIIFDDNPYILVVFTNRGQKEYTAFFKDVSNKVNEIHKDYNHLKADYCNNIK